MRLRTTLNPPLLPPLSLSHPPPRLLLITGTKLEFLRAQIHHTDELVSFRLDTFRNDLLIADVTLAIVMISLTVGTYVTGTLKP